MKKSSLIFKILIRTFALGIVCLASVFAIKFIIDKNINNGEEVINVQSEDTTETKVSEIVLDIANFSSRDRIIRNTAVYKYDSKNDTFVEAEKISKLDLSNGVVRDYYKAYLCSAFEYDSYFGTITISGAAEGGNSTINMYDYIEFYGEANNFIFQSKESEGYYINKAVLNNCAFLGCGASSGKVASDVLYNSGSITCETLNVPAAVYKIGHYCVTGNVGVSGHIEVSGKITTAIDAKTVSIGVYLKMDQSSVKGDILCDYGTFDNVTIDGTVSCMSMTYSTKISNLAIIDKIYVLGTANFYISSDTSDTGDGYINNFYALAGSNISDIEQSFDTSGVRDCYKKIGNFYAYEDSIVSLNSAQVENLYVYSDYVTLNDSPDISNIYASCKITLNLFDGNPYNVGKIKWHNNDESLYLENYEHNNFYKIADCTVDYSEYFGVDGDKAEWDSERNILYYGFKQIEEISVVRKNLSSDDININSSFTLQDLQDKCALKVYAEFNTGVREIVTTSEYLRLLTPDGKVVTDFSNYPEVVIGGYCDMVLEYSYGGATATCGITLKKNAISLKNATFTEISEQTYTGAELTPSFKVTCQDKVLGKGVDYEVVYANNVNAGTANITVTGTGNYQHSRTIQFKINPKQIDSTFSLSLSETEVTYTGLNFEPTTTLVGNGTTLVNDDDYTVVYLNNINAGTATVTCTGTGNYTGTISKEFIINPYNISTSVLKLSDVVYNYNQEAHTPITSIIGPNNISIGADGNYEVEYSNNTNVGTATVTCTGYGNYTGTKSTNFEIKTVAIPVFLTTDIANLKAEVYETLADVVVETNENGSWSFSEVDLEYTFTTADVYSFRATFNPIDTNYLPLTQIAIVTVSRMITTFELDDIVHDFDYTGVDVSNYVTNNTEATPIITYYDSEGLIMGSSPVNAGDYKVTFKFEETVAFTEAEFSVNITVNPVSLIDYDFAYELNHIYTSTSINPEVVVTDGSYELVIDKDFSILYTNNVDVTNEAKIVITGNNNYKDEKELLFTINPRDINEVTVADVETYKYTGKEITPEVNMTYGEEDLVINVDYTLEAFDNVEISSGTAYAEVTAIGNYTGSLKIYFDITIGQVTIDMYPQLSNIECYIEQTLSELELPSNENGQWYFIDSETTSVGSATQEGRAFGVVFKPVNTNFADYESTVLVIVNKYLGEVVISGTATKVYDGNTIDSLIIGYNGTGSGTNVYEFNYYNEAGIKLNADPVNVGTYLVEVSMIGDDFYQTVSSTIEYTITKETIADNSNFEFVEIPDQEYNIVEIFPELTINYRGNKLVKGVDYTISYDNNTTVGTAVIEVTGIGNFQGEYSDNFEIIRKTITPDMIGRIVDQLYYAVELTPNVPIYHNNESLRQNIDFVATYTNNIEVGSANVSIEGIGLYVTETPIEITFNIVQKVISIDEIPALRKIHVEVGTNRNSIVLPSNISGAWNFVEADDYVFTASDEGGITIPVVFNPTSTYYRDVYSNVTVIVSRYEGQITILNDLNKQYDGKAVEVEFDSLSTGTQIVEYFKGGQLLANAPVSTGDYLVRVTVLGDDTYLDASVDYYFTIKTKKITEEMISLDALEYEFTGSLIEPNVTVIDEGTLLVKDVDYSVYYVDNLEEGNSYVIVSGMGNYSPLNVSKLFSITGGSVGNEGVETPGEGEGEGETPEVQTKTLVYSTVNQTYQYTGLAICPEITITVKETSYVLVEGTDYIIEYTDNINVGLATITITLQGDYSGNKTITFNIVKVAINSLEIPNISDILATGSAITPSIELSYLDNILVLNTDYIVEYSNNVEPGVASVLITGIGNYSGTVEKTFNIIQPESELISIVDGNDTLKFVEVSVTGASNASITAISHDSYNGSATILYGLECGITIQELLVNLEYNFEIIVLDASGNVIDSALYGQTLVTTNTLIKLVNQGNVCDEVILAVRGDTLCNGTYAKNPESDMTQLDLTIVAAFDVNKSMDYSSIDYRRFSSFV